MGKTLMMEILQTFKTGGLVVLEFFQMTADKIHVSKLGIASSRDIRHYGFECFDAVQRARDR